jgi:hypothetical protein
LAAGSTAGSFYVHLTDAPWRWWAQGFSLLVLTGVGYYFLAALRG